jgi:basic membrane protein A and related proteins
VLAMVIAACTPAATPTSAPATQAPQATEPAATEAAGAFQIPDIEEGKFNVAMVLIGPHDDGGWSQAHYEGLQYVQENVENVHTAYIELVPEGADSEQVYRSLARKGFDLIFGTSFGYMDAMATVAEEFPDQMFIHISGFKTNGKNFGNLFGAMEVMKYIAGMIAGSRAKVDGNPKLGYMATFPIPEELRLGNAIALGMRRTCPECTMDVRWINTWHDPVIEKEAAASLFDSGVQVVFTGADTPAAGDVAQEKGKWGVNYDWVGSCKVERCLTAPYWNWGPVYAEITRQTQAGTYTPGSQYFDADSGALGLYGLMEGQQPTPGMADLPEEDMKLVRDTLAAALAGEFTRFDVFAGPIEDNKGNTVVPEGGKIEQIDIDCFAGGEVPCKTGMYWWAEGVTAELPELSQ